MKELIGICFICIQYCLIGQVINVNGTALTASGGAPSNCVANGYKTVNSASVAGNCVTFTTASFTNGAIWACTPIDLNQSFKLTFNASFGTNTAAGDGIAFLLQTEGVPQVIGGRAGGIGYAQGDGTSCQGAPCPIDPSVAVEFDTWDNTAAGINDLACDHVSIQRNGIMNAANALVGANCLNSSGATVKDGLSHAVCITWDPAINNYRVYFDGNLVANYSGNIRTNFTNPSSVFWGFTSASGGGAQTQSVCNVNLLTNLASPSCICTVPVATATPAFQSICSNNSTNIILTSSVTGTTFSWSTIANASINGETTSGGTGSTINDLLTNTTNTPITLNYSVIPTASGCVGAAITVPITVNPSPAISPIATSACSQNGFSVTPANGTNGVVPTGTTYSWSAPAVTGGMTGGAAGTNASSISGTLTNTTNTPQTATYTVTPNAGSCTGATFTVTLTVNPSPNFSISPNNPTSCGSSDGTISLTGLAINTTYLLSYNDDGVNIGPISMLSNGSGIITINNLNAGLYSNIIVALNSCSSVPQSIVLASPSSPIFAINPMTQPSSCGGNQGSIQIEGTGNLLSNTNYTLNYFLNGNLIGPNNITTDNNSDYVLSGLVAGTYTNFSLNISGCSGSSTSIVTLNNPISPIAVASTNTPQVCTSNSITLNANFISGATYSWTGPNNFSSTLQSPIIANSTTLANGNYSLTITLNNCVSNTSTVNVIVNQSPNLLITPPSPVCSPLTIDITSAQITSGSSNLGTLSYWYDSNATIPVSNPSSQNSSGMIFIQASNQGCTDLDSVLVTIIATPNLNITNPNPICSPGTIDLTNSSIISGSSNLGAMSYWSDAQALNPLANPTSINTSGIFYIQSSLNGCFDIQPVNVIINQSPNLIISNPNSVCSPLGIDLTSSTITSGSTNLGNLFYWNDAAATVSLINPMNINSSGTYYIQSVSGSCIDIESVIVNIIPPYSFNVSSTTPSACNIADGSIQLSSLLPNTSYLINYSFSGSSFSINQTSSPTGTILLNSLSAGNYTNIQLQNQLTGCASDNIENVDLTNPLAPNLSEIGNVSSCDIFILPSINGINLNGSESYFTQPSGNGTQLFPGDTIFASQQLYAYVNSGGCNDEDTFSISIIPTPQINQLTDTIVCGSFNLPVITGSNLSGNESYYNNLPASGGVSLSGTLSSSQTIYIFDSVSSCSYSDSFNLIVNIIPTLSNFSGGGTYCEGDAIDSILLNINGTPNFSINYTFNGNPITYNSSSNEISIGNDAGNYVILEIADNNCSNTVNEEIIIMVNSTPPIPNIFGDTSFCLSDEPTILSLTNNGFQYNWYSDVNLSNLLTTGNNIQLENTVGSSVYYVTLSNQNCESTPQSVLVNLIACDIIVPTAFTPNDDDANNYWEIPSIDELYPKNVVYVYNRWGNLLFQSEQGNYASKPWDGKYNGESLSVGSYYFIIELNNKNKEVKKGIISIIK